MRQLISSLLLLLSVNFLLAQSVGIGTSTPNSKAALEINSTTKGLLIPSMTSIQRALIASPPDGLMVYDTDLHLFYHYDGSAWRKITNSTFWNNSSTRNYVYNTTDSIGIGTSVPTQRLDVSGNIRSRGDIVADDGITADGAVQGATLIATGNIVTGGTATVNGDLSTNSDLIINNTTATFQLKAAGENKGYFQLSGDNVRMGTNSGNSTGNLIIRMNGTDRVFVDQTGKVGVGITSPTEKLDVNGNINFDGKLTSSQTGNAPLTPLCWGMSNINGGVIRSTANVNVTRIATGQYRITCPGITSTSVAIVSAHATSVFVGWQYSAANQITVFTRAVLDPNNGAEDFDQVFSFIIY